MEVSIATHTNYTTDPYFLVSITKKLTSPNPAVSVESSPNCEKHQDGDRY